MLQLEGTYPYYFYSMEDKNKPPFLNYEISHRSIWSIASSPFLCFEINLGKGPKEKILFKYYVKLVAKPIMRRMLS